MQIKRHEINEQMHNHIQKHNKHIKQENIKRVVAIIIAFINIVNRVN